MIRTIAPLLLGIGILIMGNGLAGIILPIKMSNLLYSEQISGLVMAFYYVGFAFGARLAQRIIGNLGHVRAFAALSALVSAAVLSYGLLPGMITWALLRCLNGFAMAVLFAIVESWLSERSANHNRGRILSLYMVTSYFASGSGQLLVNIYDTTGVELFALAGLILVIALVPVILTKNPSPDIQEITPLSFRQLYQLSPLGIIGVIGAGLLSGGFYGMGAIFAAQAGFITLEKSLFLFAAILGGLLIQWPVGKLSDRYDRRHVILWISLSIVLITGFAFIWGTLGNYSFYFVAFIALLFGGAAATLYPLSLAHAFTYVEKRSLVSANSGLLLGWALGASVGPVIVGLLMRLTGQKGFFLYAAFISLSLACFVKYRMGRRKSKPISEQAVFMPLPENALETGNLDPRTNNDKNEDKLKQ
ncbi:MAG: MFS transporter [Alphaproteobacteria bacterium]|nr:MFS transporter [Alphaproteobacteria bacterium]